MQVGVLKESFPGERRVALVPASVSRLGQARLAVIVESGAGDGAGFGDEQYQRAGATVAPNRQAVLAAPCLVAVRLLGANPAGAADQLARLRSGQVLIGLCDPLVHAGLVGQAAQTGASILALELLPRITRAQSMDVLSSMATISGYRAVLLAAVHLHKMFPLLMTAAGTLAPAHVLVLGAGVAGLQAIATARRLGAVVQAYDVRPAVKEQCESLGAKFVELALETSQAEDQAGYARQLDEAFYQRQRELLAEVVAHNDVVITTAAVPGQRSPLLVTRQAVERMRPGSVIVDLAAERGGNCQLSQPDQLVNHQGVTILGPTNLPSEVPHHASQMFSNNLTNFLLHLVRNKTISLDSEDPIARDTLLTRDGQVVHPRIRELLAASGTSA